MRKLTFLLLVYIMPVVLVAQDIDMQVAEAKLEKLLLDLRSASNNQEKKEKNNLLKIEMKRVLSDEQSMHYPFSKLNTIGFIDSPDKQMRIVNWNVEQDDFSQNYTAFVIHIDKRRKTQYVTELQDKSFGMPMQPSEIITADNWYGALYYKIIPIKKGSRTIYTVLGWDYNTSLSQMKLIDAIYFTGKTVKLGSPIFKSGKTTQKRVFFEHSKKVTMSLKYEKQRDRIIFDHLSPESPSMKKFRSFYVPDMSYDAFVLEGSKWILHEDVIGVNSGSGAKKQYVYVKNENTGKLEKKEIKGDWINPEGQNTPVDGGSHVAVTPEDQLKADDQKETADLPKVDKKDKRDPSDLSVYGDKKKRKRRKKRKF
ncbi:MAG: hypothetical protein MK105_08300 [Crocinitomicaceae bacterium]|nr:hypothetical protein [Crocinitomicaceae bacterium]